MLQNAYLDANIGVDPTENEPRKELLEVCEPWVFHEPRRGIRQAGHALESSFSTVSTPAFVPTK